MKKIMIVVLWVLCLAAPAAAKTYIGQIQNQAVVIDVQPILPQLGVIAVWIDGTFMRNIAWYMDNSGNGLMHAGQFLMAVNEAGALVVLWPGYAVLREAGNE